MPSSTLRRHRRRVGHAHRPRRAVADFAGVGVEDEQRLRGRDRELAEAAVGEVARHRRRASVAAPRQSSSVVLQPSTHAVVSMPVPSRLQLDNVPALQLSAARRADRSSGRGPPDQSPTPPMIVAAAHAQVVLTLPGLNEQPVGERDCQKQSVCSRAHLTQIQLEQAHAQPSVGQRMLGEDARADGLDEPRVGDEQRRRASRRSARAARGRWRRRASAARADRRGAGRRAGS